MENTVLKCASFQTQLQLHLTQTIIKVNNKKKFRCQFSRILSHFAVKWKKCELDPTLKISEKVRYFETRWSHILSMPSGLALENLLSSPVPNLSDGRSGMVLDEVQSLL